MKFLPLSKSEMLNRGWHYVDFVVVTGDAYVDHPSFGSAIIARLLEREGFKVGIIACPDTERLGTEAFTTFGAPRYGFFVGSGAIDSMVQKYTVAKKPRGDDLYIPKALNITRPDRALTVFSRAIKSAYPYSPVIIGGLEASLRRCAHYDYWDDKVRPSVLVDTGADLLVYGMAERATQQIAARLKKGEKIGEITDIRGTAYLSPTADGIKGVRLSSFERVRGNRAAYAKNCVTALTNADHVTGKVIIEEQQKGSFLIQNPPAPPLKQQELDKIHELPFERAWHPYYNAFGGVPAFDEVKFSITHNRGCFSSCNFCALSFHQGRSVTARSEESLLKEAEELTNHPDFKGYIHDVGGPTANFRRPSCDKQLTSGTCPDKRCLAPAPCKNLQVDHSEYLGILRKMRGIKGVKKVFVRSGIRYDYLMLEKDDTFLTELIQHHISGRLKVAPEHCAAAVTELMGKPYISVYKRFSQKFYSITKRLNKEQYLVPYLISSHPGSTLQHAIALALFLKQNKLRPEQVQDFYPTPGTISTCMYHTELNPYTGKPVYVPKSPHEKALGRALLQYFLPQNKALVIEALKKAGRGDLIKQLTTN